MHFCDNTLNYHATNVEIGVETAVSSSSSLFETIISIRPFVRNSYCVGSVISCFEFKY